MRVRNPAFLIVCCAVLAASMPSPLVAQPRGENGSRVDHDRFRENYERRERELREERTRERESHEAGTVDQRAFEPLQRPDLCEINPDLPQCKLR